ncbi:dihydrofolate reductase family protein [Corynebacterium sp. MSK297]|uniref:dihydrofolate reductase family protein n=1 Tax=Corynebacterium sp. MSK297 TaxID=3050221 RepID=UPI00254B24ED|nr:dihydrofolate reductase family protein [Corynebacterium sp. MSK297]MDK8845012.1 dihydrofolate reductase family protein [Corynebacterium sp. MSK297]
MDNRTSLAQLLGPEQRNSDGYCVRAIFASTITGSATIDGRSNDLGNELDTELLLAAREWSDVVLVGSETVRAENYGGVQPTTQKPSPAHIAVMTASMSFGDNSRFLHDYHVPHLFLVPESSLTDPHKKERAEKLTLFGQVIGVGAGSVEECIKTLVSRGFKRILCEGGPSIFSGLITANAVDQFYLTLHPTLTSTVETPITRGTTGTVTTQQMHLESVEHCPDSTLFLRYGRHPR